MARTYMDAHVHLDNLGHADLETMRLMGIDEVISPVVFDSVRPVPARTIADLWDSMLECQLPRLAGYAMRGWALIGVAMVSIPQDPDTLLELLPGYLEKPEVVGIGEVGYQPGWVNCPDVERQEYVFRAQLQIGKELGVPVDVHTPAPPDKKIEFTERALRLASEVGFDPSRLVIDHASADNIERALDAGANVAITVQPWRNLTAESAAALIARFAPEYRRIWVNSDYCIFPSDCTAVARTALALARAGLPEEVVNAVCGDNARRFFGTYGRSRPDACVG
jgi:predicted metal-dependent TIM-barrel fold hydrolase